MLQIKLPEKVRTIINELERCGEEAYAVGGCVRDSILERDPKDWDITTSAKPEKIKSIFHHTVDTGIAHGTVTVMLGKDGFEVTTYRIDGKYEDGRHPREVIFTPSLTEDLRRRDFTINAMAYNERSGLVDLFGGQEDLKAGMIRCVGAAEERLTEDALRIMRAVRFAAQLDFQIEENTAKAAQKLAGNLKLISSERIKDELVKLLTSLHPEKIADMYKLGITKVVLPEFDRMMDQMQNGKNHNRSVGEHTLKALCHVPDDRILRLTMLLHDCGKPSTAQLDERGIWQFPEHALAGAQIAVTVMRRLKFDNDTIYAVKNLIMNHSMYPVLTPEGVRRSIYRVGEAYYPMYLTVKRADIMAQREERQKPRLDLINEAERIYRDILHNGDCLSLKTLQISGSDLIADGMKPGKEIGSVLAGLLDDVLTFPEHNEKEYLLAHSRKLRNRI